MKLIGIVSLTRTLSLFYAIFQLPQPTPKLDSVMLASIALMPVFVIRRKVKAKRRHKILVRVAEDFNRREIYCAFMPACMPPYARP